MTLLDDLKFRDYFKVFFLLLHLERNSFEIVFKVLRISNNESVPVCVMLLGFPIL